MSGTFDLSGFLAVPSSVKLLYQQNWNIYNRVQAINSNGAPLTLPLPLAEFAKAYDGPPTDPKVFEETQKKLQEELQKRAEEQRKKLEANPPAGTAPANPAAK